MISLITVTESIFRRYLNQIMDIEQVSFPSPWSSHAFLEEVRNSISQFWLAREGDEVKGYICFWMYGDEIHLMNVAVHPLSRRAGIGSYLVRQMLDFALSRHIEKIWLEVRPSNLIALRLYEKLGFKEAGRRRKYYTDTNEDAIVMALSLDGFEQASYNMDASLGYGQRKAV